MSFYVEVMCDERKSWPEGSGKLNNRCVTDRGDNPQGSTIQEARNQAILEGWKVSLKHGYACCPDCQDEPKSTP